MIVADFAKYYSNWALTDEDGHLIVGKPDGRMLLPADAPEKVQLAYLKYVHLLDQQRASDFDF